MAIEANKKDVVDGRVSVETVVMANVRAPSLDMKDNNDSEEKQSLWEKGSASSATKESSASEDGSSVADSPISKKRKFGRTLASILGKSRRREKDVETKALPIQTMEVTNEKVDLDSPRNAKRKNHFASMAAELKKRFENSATPFETSEKATLIAPEKSSITKPAAVQKPSDFASIVAQLDQKLKLRTPDSVVKDVQGQEKQNIENVAEAAIVQGREKQNIQKDAETTVDLEPNKTNSDGMPAPLTRSDSPKEVTVVETENDSTETNLENVNNKLAPLVVSDSPKETTPLASPYSMEKQRTWHGFATSLQPVVECSSDVGYSKTSKPRLSAFVRLVKTRSFTKAPRYTKTPPRIPQLAESVPKKSSETVAESATTITKTTELPPKPPSKKQEEPKSVELQVKSASPTRVIPKIPRNQKPAPMSISAGSGLDPCVDSTLASPEAIGTTPTRSGETEPSKVRAEEVGVNIRHGYKLRRRLTWSGGSNNSSTSFQHSPQVTDNLSDGLKTFPVDCLKKQSSESGFQQDGDPSGSVSELGATSSAVDQPPAQCEALGTDGKPPKRKNKLAPGIFAMVKRFQGKKSRGVDEDGSLTDKSREAVPMSANSDGLPGSVSESCHQPNDVAVRPGSPRISVSSPMSWDESSALSNSLDNRLDDNATLDSGMLSFGSTAAHQQVFELFDAIGTTYSPMFTCGGGVDSVSHFDPPDEEYPRSQLKVEVVKEKKTAMEKMQEDTVKAYETTSGVVSRACEEIVDIPRAGGEFVHDMFKKARNLRQLASEQFAVTTDRTIEGQQPESLPEQATLPKQATVSNCLTSTWNWFDLLCSSPGTNSPLDDMLSEEKIVEY